MPLTLTDDDVGDDSSDWIIRDIIPRAESWLLAGPPKAGKTWTALSLAAHLALGKDWLGFTNTLGRPARVLVLTLEDAQRRVEQRLREILRGIEVAPSDALVRDNLRLHTEPIRIPGADVETFIAECHRWDPDVVMIDSLTRTMAGDQNSIGDAAQFTSSWTEIVRRTGASVGFLHHLNKGGGRGDPFRQVRGSGELVATARNALVMDLAVGSTSSRVSVRGNLDLQRDSFALDFQRDGNRVVMTSGPVVAGARRPKRTKPDRRAGIERAALEIAKDSLVTQAALARHFGTDATNASRDYGPTLRGLHDRGLLERVAGGSVITSAGVALLTG